MRSIKTNVISDEDINSVDPRVIIAIPRLTIISALHHMPESVNVTDAEKGFRLFREKAERMKILKDDLDKLSADEIGVLEEMLVDCDAWDKSLKRPSTVKTLAAGSSDDTLATLPDVSGLDIDGQGDETLTRCDEFGDLTLLGVDNEIEAVRGETLSLMDEKYLNQRDTMHRVYREVCGVADDMQRGPRAREFVGLLHKAFTMHTDQ